jgi:hypothetical protein
VDDESASGQAARFGLISVTYGHVWAETGQNMLLSTGAQFVRYSAMNRDQVARLLALPLDPDRDLPPPDRCKLYDLSVDLAAAPAAEGEDQGSVELLEAGDLEVQTVGRAVTLAPKHFPGLLPFISGVVYGEAEATLVETVGKVRASTTGGEAVGPFAAQLSSPELPRLIQIGTGGPGQGLALARDRDLPLRWQVSPDPAGDVVYVELRFGRGGRDLAVRCQPRDDGAFEIPQAMLSDVSGRVTVELARLRRTFFSATGLDQGELRVTVRDIATLE